MAALKEAKKAGKVAYFVLDRLVSIRDRFTKIVTNFYFTPSECRYGLTLCRVVGALSLGVSRPLKFWITTEGAK